MRSSRNRCVRAQWQTSGLLRMKSIGTVPSSSCTPRRNDSVYRCWTYCRSSAPGPIVPTCTCARTLTSRRWGHQVTAQQLADFANLLSGFPEAPKKRPSVCGRGVRKKASVAAGAAGPGMTSMPATPWSGQRIGAARSVVYRLDGRASERSSLLAVVIALHVGSVARVRSAGSIPDHSVDPSRGSYSMHELSASRSPIPHRGTSDPCSHRGTSSSSPAFRQLSWSLVRRKYTSSV